MKKVSLSLASSLALTLLLTLVSALVSTLALTQSAFAQQITLRGQVSILNSGYHNHGKVQYVDNAAISAPRAGSDITDTKGNFALTFVGQDTSSIVTLTVAKHGYVVANARDLQAVDLGRKSPLQIYLADSAALAQEQALLYEINLKVLTAEKDALIAKLKSDSATSRATLAELQDRFGMEFEHRWAAEDFLNEQLEEVRERLPEQAAELARVNLDFASERYRRAYALMLEGKTELVFGSLEGLDAEAAEVEQQMKALGADSLRYHTASDSIDLGARQVVDCYRLKAEAHSLRFEYRKAAEDLEKGLGLLLRVKRGRKDLEVADTYFDLSEANIDQGDLEAAYKYLQQELEIEQSSANVPDGVLAETYVQIAVVLYYMQRFAKALEFEKIAIGMMEAKLGNDHPDLAKAYNNLSLIFVGLKEYENAIDAIRKSQMILKNIPESGDYYLAYSLYSMAGIYQGMGNYADALATTHTADSIIGLRQDVGSPILAKSSSLQASILCDIGDYQKAKEAISSAISWQEKNLQYDDPNLLASLDVLASILQYMRDYSGALSIFERILASRKTIYGLGNIVLVESYYDLGGVFICMGRYEKAIAVFDSAYHLDSLEVSYLNHMSIVNAKAGDFVEAKTRLRRLHRILPQGFLYFRNYSFYYALRNRHKKCLASLEKAIRLGYSDLNWIKSIEAFDALRDHPRYIALIKSLEEKQK